MNSALLALALATTCDWKVIRETDPMTDKARCTIHSERARLYVGVHDGTVRLSTGSPYRLDYLTIRVDDREPITLSYADKVQGSQGGPVKTVLDQILEGVRIRVSYKGARGFVNGDAPICNLPELIRSCR
jgi:hypothetical protein